MPEPVERATMIRRDPLELTLLSAATLSNSLFLLAPSQGGSHIGHVG